MVNDEFISFPIKIGISTCLLGEKVRFDGGHKHDRYLTDILGKYFNFVSACPEIEIGMGVPRDSVRLVNIDNSVRMIGPKTGIDWTDRMISYSTNLIKRLSETNIFGYIFKSDSPTCGIERVRVYNKDGIPQKNGTGIFTNLFRTANPLIPVEEEGRLNDAKIRENFITRIFCYSRLHNLFYNNFNRGRLVHFHTIHKYLLMAHSIKHYETLGQLVANAKNIPASQLKVSYSKLFMEAIAIKTTTKKNVNVLHHILGYLKDYLSTEDKKDILTTIEDYRNLQIPLIVPLTLLKHYINKISIEHLKNQVYLNPHPKELMLRNHV